MRDEQLQRLYKDYTKAHVDKYIKWVPLNTITGVNQRARANGNQQDNISNFASLFGNGQKQLTPVSLRGSEVQDGASRYRGKQKAAIADPSQRILVCTYMDEVLNFSDEDWHDWQDNANNHPNARPTTNEDIDMSIRERIKKNTLIKRVRKETGDRIAQDDTDGRFEEFCTIAGKCLHADLWYNQPFTPAKIAGRVRAVLVGAVNIKAGRTTYDQKELVKNYDEFNVQGWTGKNFKVVAGNTHVAILSSYVRIDPNIGGVMLKNSEENPGVTQVVLISLKSLNGKTDAEISEERRKCAAKLYRYADKLQMKLIVEHSEQLPSDKPGFTEIHRSAQGAPVVLVESVG